MSGAVWMLWIGCPWVTSVEHQQNRRDLVPPPDADVDVDVDTDTDTDTDTADTDTGPVACVDDPFEPNEVPGVNATEVTPGELDAVLCTDNLDIYEIDVGPTDVLEVTLSGRAETTCDQLTMSVSLRDGAGVPFPDATRHGCDTVRAGWGPGRYQIWASDGPSAAVQDYRLGIERVECRDEDGDGFLAVQCGGPDCHDRDPTVYPGAPDPQDGIDQDCDGGDDLDPLGCEIVTGSDVEFGTVPCGDLQADPVWDGWTVPVGAGSLLSVVVDNDALGSADLLAMVIDADGTSHYGLSPDRLQLDDEQACLSPPWSGERCPAACVALPTEGLATIWVAQHPGAGCVPDANYRLLVYVDSVPAVLTLTADDVVLPFPP